MTATSYAYNYGGAGGAANTGNGNGGAGGTSTTTATASAAGTGTVTVDGNAYGGNGGTGQGAGRSGGAGGDAVASASGSGLGAVTTSALANGGVGGTGSSGASFGTAGSALATATGTGTSGNSTAGAEAGSAAANGKLVRFVDSNAVAPTYGTSSAQASANIGGAITDVASAATRQSAAFATGAPTNQTVLPVVRNSAVLANFDIAGTTGGSTVLNSPTLNSDVYGYGVLGGGYSANGTGSRTYTSTDRLRSGHHPVDFGQPAFARRVHESAGARQRLGSGTYLPRRPSTAIFNQTIASPAAAQTYFNDRTVDLGTPTISGVLDYRMQLDFTSSDAGAKFATDVIGPPCREWCAGVRNPSGILLPRCSTTGTAGILRRRKRQ